jgi:2,4-dienoyl-CoA reductase-like NADH-dependent reductase (Old Yellow Enzyme family)
VTYPRIGHHKTVAAFRAHLAALGLELPTDERVLSAADGSPLARPITVGPGDRAFTVGNRWCIHPMEGWDGTADGRPSAHTVRRWRRFGLSGSKLIWGGEAFAVQHDGRANPNQLYYRAGNVEPMRDLLATLTQAHRERFGRIDDLLVGLQLTHSGRFSRPNNKKRLEPRIAYHHPLLDAKVGVRAGDDSALLSDDAIKRIIANFVAAAVLARDAGFRFVDVKHCHGYLGHEFLSAFDRPGPYGGDFAGRTRFLRETVEAIRAECPTLMIGVRLSIFDTPPFHSNEKGSGVLMTERLPTPFLGPFPAFGVNRDNPLEPDLAEPVRLLEMLRDDLKVDMVNLSAGSPYYNPHVQRPAYFPPSDGYPPPEDPLVGCVRQIALVRELKRRVPGLPMVGTAYSYFQEYLPHVAQAVVREGWVDVVGLGRMVLAYPELPADCLEAGELRTPKQLCRTFSDCTTGPRNGLVSGCYPLDDYYKSLPAAAQLKHAKHAARGDAPG